MSLLRVCFTYFSSDLKIENILDLVRFNYLLESDNAKNTVLLRKPYLYFFKDNILAKKITHGSLSNELKVRLLISPLIEIKACPPTLEDYFKDLSCGSISTNIKSLPPFTTYPPQLFSGHKITLFWLLSKQYRVVMSWHYVVAHFKQVNLWIQWHDLGNYDVAFWH